MTEIALNKISTDQPADVVCLKQQLRQAQRSRKLKAIALVAPLMLFLFLVFVLPIASLLYKAVDNPELQITMPQAVQVIAQWDGQALPDEKIFATIALDLKQAKQGTGHLGLIAKRLNYEITGFRSVIYRTAKKLPKENPASWKDKLMSINKKWGEIKYWHAFQRAAKPLTPYYFLASVDHKVSDQGHIEALPEHKSLYAGIFGRTLWMGAVVTIFCLLLGYPLAYLLVILPKKTSNLLMIMVLLPFWTSLLVRTASWIVLLQAGGLINGGLMWSGIIDEPIQLVFNRIGVYIAMVHIMLPFMILPLYSVMKGIPPSYLRAAVSLGAHPWLAFLRVYVPQTLAGIGAGCLLVYILSIGYYITPALIGSPQDQMISYFVAFFTNNTIKWGMAAALGTLLLVATLILYAAYNRIVGADRMKLG